MIKRPSRSLLCISLFLAGPASVSAADGPALAREIVVRRFGKAAVRNVQFQTMAGKSRFDTFEFEARRGRLTVRGSSPVALASGYYQFIRRKGLGMSTWAGTRLDLSKGWPDAPRTRVTTPYRYRYYFNVVTYGYSMPYWTWDRWQQELDWMALHGINMPLALVGTEAIGERVWKKLGLTSSEIQAHFTGPAFLPWQRMGNINRHNGPFPKTWNDGQVTLQHKILRRMRQMGMEPIVPGFAGFVPKGLTRIYPDAKLHGTSWGGFGKEDSAYLLDARSPHFAPIGKMFVQEWEKEFGKATYYLADSFNEMELPQTSTEEKHRLLADYGDTIYRSIKAGNPHAVWVVQGWMLGFQRDIWTKEALYALVSKVPNDKMLILDLAADYSAKFWRNGLNWDFYQGFAGKNWVYSVIPNMGGKTAWTGHLDYYAKGTVEALQSPNRGNLIGSGFAPEGIENNEALYELLADLWWRTDAVDLDAWIAVYCRARYGAFPAKMKEAWSLLRMSAYGSFTDHPLMSWQTRAQMKGTVNDDPRFFKAVEAFLDCAPELRGSKLYQADAMELSALYLGLRAEESLRVARMAQQRDADSPIVQEIFRHGIRLLAESDRLLESHPLDRLERWIAFARANGSSPEDKKYYESDARRIVTLWGGGIRDYSGRMWSGLIRDFYVPRLKAERAALATRGSFDFDAWENAWIASSGISRLTPFGDSLREAVRLVEAASRWKMPTLPPSQSPFQWRSREIETEWSERLWDISPKITRAGTVNVRFLYTGGAHRLEIDRVELLEDGKVVASDEHRGSTGDEHIRNLYALRLREKRPGAKYVLRVRLRTDGGNDSNGEVVVTIGA